MQHKDIPRLVKHLRERMELTQEKFALAVGVTFSTVNQWENGHRQPHPFLLKRLVDMEKEMAKKKARHER